MFNKILVLVKMQKSCYCTIVETSVVSYRPTALTGCQAKSFENFVNIRLTFILGSHEILEFVSSVLERHAQQPTI